LVLPAPPGDASRGFAPPAPFALVDGELAPSPRALGSLGSAHLLVILAEFSDTPHRIDPSRFEGLLFASSSSVRAYYLDASEGAFQITGDIHGWVALPGTEQHYSQNAGGVGAYPTNGQKMVEDAISAALSMGLDLDSYDANGDGIVDALLVVHSGQGLEWSSNAASSSDPNPSAINSHKWVVRQSSYPGESVRVQEYFTCPELQLVRPIVAPAWSDSISTIGVYCHELGHILGLPDFYDTQTGVNRIGVWEIMDYGNWNPAVSTSLPPGALPAEFSAWSKMFLHWVSPEIVAANAGEVHSSSRTVHPATFGESPLQLLPNPQGVNWTSASSGRGEFFLAELRVRSGFDGGLPDSGLLIYHVDEGRESNNASDNPDGGGLVVLVPQDGVVSISPVDSRGDPWPGPQTTFNDTSSPS
jgi:M6 family metalloprotease-like protein